MRVLFLQKLRDYWVRYRIMCRDTLYNIILVMMLAWGLQHFPLNLHVFDPVYHAFKDFDLTDIWYSKLSKKEKLYKQPFIRIVNVSDLGRDSIAKVIHRINSFQPAVIGVDLMFENRRDSIGDSSLDAAIGSANNVVLANTLTFSKVEGKLVELSNSASVLGSSHIYGFANFIGNPLNTIRHFTPLAILKGDTVESFSSQLVKRFSASAYRDLIQRGCYPLLINYKANLDGFKSYEAVDIIEGKCDSSEFAECLVLIGVTDKFSKKEHISDLHYTPLNPDYAGKAIPDMKGIVVHANIISMVLQHDYITETPKWLDLLLAFVLGFGYTFMSIYFFVNHKLHKWFHAVAKASQVLLSLGFMMVSYGLMVVYGIKLNVTLTVLVIVLVIDFLYFYEAAVKYLKNRRNWVFDSSFLSDDH